MRIFCSPGRSVALVKFVICIDRDFAHGCLSTELKMELNTTIVLKGAYLYINKVGQLPIRLPICVTAENKHC